MRLACPEKLTGPPPRLYDVLAFHRKSNVATIESSSEEDQPSYKASIDKEQIILLH